jgi:uncharacterized membrane protein (UPF0182 family)
MRNALRLAILAVIVVLVAFVLGAGWLQKLLWMKQLGYLGIFWGILSVEWGLAGIAFMVALLFFWINFRVASRAMPTHGDEDWELRRLALERAGIVITPSGIKRTGLTAAAAVGVIFALIFYGQWNTYLRFHYGGSFGLADPLFKTDVGFYVFRLPFYELLQNSVIGLVIITLAAVLLAYAYFGVASFRRGHLSVTHSRAGSHLSVLLFILAADLGWGFYLDHFDLLYSTMGVVYGAGCTADHVTRLALWMMLGLSVAACVLLVFSFFRPRWRAIVAGAAAYFALYILGVVVAPALYQKLSVLPNELERETPYLAHYISFTQKAYKLDAIQDTSYPALLDLTPDAIARNQPTIQNVRLWDSRPLLQTFRQTQEIRLYYQFYGVDVDRYHLADGYHQVMLATRELASELPAKAQTWVNERLQFTHGYGLVMNFVSKTVTGGFPQYLLQNIPPESDYGLTVSQPSIYYGKYMPGYRIVATGIKEFDYPKGDQNVYTSYNGKGGIPVDSLWKRLLFAWTQRDINILLTSYVEPQSRIQIWRQVGERVAQVAPFLTLDGDPYAVLSRGRLYWIQDAYTVSDHFPYSAPYQVGFGQNVNYIRNSVKVVVDMYDGTVSFYVMDPKDPVLAVYRRAFPGVFKDLSELSPDLKAHLRYPEDLFSIQADQYRTFHMTVPQVFYNQEDLWVFAQEKYAGKSIPMRPYYILMKLPGSDTLEYLLMTPFTPQNRDNMIAWMAARCDFPEYGKTLVYELPKEKLIYGPSQIEAMIDQTTEISRQLSLWDQRGSRVIRGNLIVIPIENSFLYVEPLYLTAEGANFPQLKRVIVVAADQVAMQPTLDEALNAVFNGQQPTQPAMAAAPVPAPQLKQARAQLAAAQQALQQGDWMKFGQAMAELQRLLTGPSH